MPIKVFLDKETYPLGVRVGDRYENVKVKGMGRFNLKKIHPQVVAGNVFNEDAQMTVWVADDATNIPVMIESPVSVGSVKVILKEYSGLKHELSSKIR